MTESTTEFTERVKGEGRFAEFKAFRQALEARGVGKKESWEQAASQFGWEAPSGPASTKRRSSPISVDDDVNAEGFAGKRSNLRSDYQSVVGRRRMHLVLVLGDCYSLLAMIRAVFTLSG